MISIVDIETTGLDASRHEIIEIGLLIFDPRNMQVVKKGNLFVKPEHPETGDFLAAIVNGYNEEAWDAANNLKSAMAVFSGATDGTILLAQNVTFDWSFIREAERKTGIRTHFDYHRLDLMSMVYAKTGEILSLKNMCRRFKIEPEPDVHRALAGAEKAFEIYKEIME